MVVKDETPSKLSLNLEAHQDELIQIAELAGVHMDPDVFRNVVELLNLGVKPQAIYHVLRKIRRSSKKASKHSNSS